MAHALSAVSGVDFVDFNTLVNSIIWTFWLADVAVYALIGDHQSHDGLATFIDFCF